MLLDPEIRPPVPQEVDWSDYELERELPQRTVIIGDLNGQYIVLRRLLLGLKLIRKDGGWCGGKTLFVQMGDIPNRGANSRAAMDLLIGLRPQAREAGGDVIWLLGNHEVMSALGHEAYVTAEEYMEFATQEEVDRFYVERTKFIYELLGAPDVPSYVEPLGGKLKAWEETHAPGRSAYRFEMGERGFYGSYLRKLPIAFRVGRLLFVHGGLSPRWADRGIRGLDEEVRRTWGSSPKFYQELDANGVFRDPLGPLWHRAYCVANARLVRDDLEEALSIVGCTQMIVGHTRTDSVENGRIGTPLVKQRGRLIMSDVGIGDPGEAGCALVVEKNRVECWTPGGTRSKVVSIKRK